ncbi:hypothetical protein [Jeotgalibacillus proteolyticus]|nr:hypothetical protein [Jeotgalibacillus proteolyticus]
MDNQADSLFKKAKVWYSHYLEDDKLAGVANLPIDRNKTLTLILIA